MYRIYVNYENMVIEEYDSWIAYNIMYHLYEHDMLTHATYTDIYGTTFTIVL